MSRRGFSGTEVRDTEIPVPEWFSSPTALLCFFLGTSLAWAGTSPDGSLLCPTADPKLCPSLSWVTHCGWQRVGTEQKGTKSPSTVGCETNPVSKPWYLHFRVFQLRRSIWNSCPWHGFLQKCLTLNDGTAVIPRTFFLHRLKLWPHFACKLTEIIT